MTASVYRSTTVLRFPQFYVFLGSFRVPIEARTQVIESLEFLCRRCCFLRKLVEYLEVTGYLIIVGILHVESFSFMLVPWHMSVHCLVYFIAYLK